MALLACFESLVQTSGGANPFPEPDTPNNLVRSIAGARLSQHCRRTMEKPTGVLDPDMAAPGTTVSEGQCCDPLATGGALPACNSYRLTSDFVAAAAEITDAPADKLQQDCGTM